MAILGDFEINVIIDVRQSHRYEGEQMNNESPNMIVKHVEAISNARRLFPMLAS